MKNFAIIFALALFGFRAYAHEPYKGHNNFWITSATIAAHDISSRAPVFALVVAHHDDGSAEGQAYIMMEIIGYPQPEFTEGNELLIRTKAREVIELRNAPPNDEIRRDAGDCIAFYQVTREQLEALSSDVIKVRVRHSGGIYEHNYGMRTGWRHLAAEYQAVVQAMREDRAAARPNSLQDIREGF